MSDLPRSTASYRRRLGIHVLDDSCGNDSFENESNQSVGSLSNTNNLNGSECNVEQHNNFANSLISINSSIRNPVNQNPNNTGRSRNDSRHFSNNSHGSNLSRNSHLSVSQSNENAERSFFGFNQTQEDVLEEERLQNDYPHIFDDSSDDEMGSSEENSLPRMDTTDNEDDCILGPFRNLHDLMEKEEEMKTVITTPLIVSKSEVMLGVIKFAVIHKLSQTAIEDLFKLINSFFIDKIVPDTKYFINKFFSSSENVQFHAVCYKCDTYIRQFNETERKLTCTACQTMINLKDPTYTDYFVIYDVAKEIASLIQQNSEYFENLKNNPNNYNDVIRDLTDGLMYKKILSSLSDEEKKNFVSAIINSDGSPIFVSSNFSLWPIQLIINEIPYNERIKKPVVCGIWFGKGKPDMDIFFRPFVEQMKELADVGVKCTINGNQRRLKVYAICCCVDSQARAPMQGIKQSNGYYGCSWCLHPGLNVKQGRGRSIKYVNLDVPVSQRTESNLVLHALEALDENEGKGVKGVKKITVLADLPKFNIVDGFVPDILHCNNLGNGERFLKYWIDSNKLPYSLDKEDIDKINFYLQNVKLPNQLQRLSRDINDRFKYKGVEYENWILFLSDTILKAFPKFQPYANHWNLFVRGYYILMQDSVTQAELQQAHELLTEFVIETERLYSQGAMTYNVHQLLHLTSSVVNWGPALTHSGYCFESGNGDIVQMVHGAKGVTRQISKAISMRQCVLYLQEFIQMEKPESSVLDFVSYLDQKYAKHSLKVTNARYFGKHYPTKTKVINELSLSLHARTYKKMVQNRCLFTSCNISRLRSDNSFAITVDKHYVKLVEFIVDPIQSMEYTLCHLVEVEQNNNPSKRIISVSNVLTPIDTNRIHKVCVHLASDVLKAEYICAVPNLYYV